MTDLPDLTRQALYWALLKDAVTSRANEVRAALDDAMRDSASLKQGDRWGTISRTGGAAEGVILDEAAVLAWTKAHRPDMLQEVLRPAWVDWLKMSAAESGVACDPETGEVIPGVGVRNRPEGLRIVTKPEAKLAAHRLMRRVTEDLPALLAEEKPPDADSR